MLNRKQARNTNCPVYVSGMFRMCQDKVKQLIHEKPEVAFCRAEKCPKWVDAFAKYEGIKSHCANFECSECGDIEDYLNKCLSCDEHFGKCGG